ncbi:MAG: TldD/PmbA family protein [Candidatus Eremiobacteraeota bacterium]|nr:TldD/PmbA family protein [Candidatus Eremiobacteraeota bacterium]
MKRRLSHVLEYARKKGATYADVRWVKRHYQNLSAENCKVEQVADNRSEGFGIRVIVRGRWGFSSTYRKDRRSLERMADEAIKIAKSSALTPGVPVKISKERILKGKYSTYYQIDPFTVPLGEKLALIIACTKEMMEVPMIRVARASLSFYREEKIFMNTEGTIAEQEILHSGGGTFATAVDGDEIQTRSYPASFDGNIAAAGFEYVEKLRLLENSRRIAREAHDLLYAKQCPSGIKDVILGTAQLALQVHESCGHPAELDRVLGTEASYAGTSFITPAKRWTLQYGSPEVSITADATLPGGLGSFGFDDEGVPAQRVFLVERGIYKNYLTSRETAAEFDERSNGTMRADGWSRIPLIRMTNINLEPGNWTTDEIIKTTKDGIYMETNHCWSIDERRLNFQFGCEIAYEIKNGKKGKLIKNSSYTGITPEFWNSCDAIANRNEWKLWGIAHCGKGEPCQIMRVGHGTSPARFRNVRVGIGKWKK